MLAHTAESGQQPHVAADPDQHVRAAGLRRADQVETHETRVAGDDGPFGQFRQHLAT